MYGRKTVFLSSCIILISLWESRETMNLFSFKSKFLEPVLTTHLRLIESDSSKTYTSDIFKEVNDEIMKVGALIVKNLNGWLNVHSIMIMKTYLYVELMWLLFLKHFTSNDISNFPKCLYLYAGWDFHQDETRTLSDSII